MDLSTIKTNLSEMKTELIGKKAVYEQQRANAERTIEELKNSLNNLKDEDISFLDKHGFNAGWLKEIDISRLSSDENYLEITKANVEELCQKLYDTLLEEVK